MQNHGCKSTSSDYVGAFREKESGYRSHCGNNDFYIMLFLFPLASFFLSGWQSAARINSNDSRVLNLTATWPDFLVRAAGSDQKTGS